MRELKRSIARNLMKMHGVEQINKKKFLIPGSKKKRSYFSLCTGETTSTPNLNNVRTCAKRLNVHWPSTEGWVFGHDYSS